MKTSGVAAKNLRLDDEKTIKGRLQAGLERSVDRCADLFLEMKAESPRPPLGMIIRLATAREKKGWKPLPPVAQERRTRRARLVSDFVHYTRMALEIEGWLFSERRLKTERERQAKKLEEMFGRAQPPYPYEMIKLLQELAPRPRRGAPPKKRALAIEALEARRLDANKTQFSWMRFTLKHCKCGKPHHDVCCKETIRQEAMALKRIMEKYHLLPEAVLGAQSRRRV